MSGLNAVKFPLHISVIKFEKLLMQNEYSGPLPNINSLGVKSGES